MTDRQEVWWGESVSADLAKDRVYVHLIGFDGTERPDLEMDRKTAVELSEHLGGILAEWGRKPPTGSDMERLAYLRGRLTSDLQCVEGGLSEVMTLATMSDAVPPAAIRCVESAAQSLHTALARLDQSAVRRFGKDEWTEVTKEEQ